jgi:ribose transport system substrate-binding protein
MKPQRLRRRTALVMSALAAVALATAAAGCSSAGSSSGGSSGNTSSSSQGGSSGSANIAAADKVIAAGLAPPSVITQTVPLPAKPGPGSIVFVSNGLPDTEVIANGTRAAAQAVGWSYSSIPYDASNPASLQQALLNALAKHPTVVTEAGNPQSQFGASVISRYQAAHVLLIPTSTSPVSKSGSIQVTDANIPNGYATNKAMAEVLAAWFVKNSGGKGKALITNVTAYPTLQGVVDGFTQETAKLCPACSVQTVPISLSEVAGGTVVSTSVSAVQRTGANYLVFDNGEFGTGAEAALKTAGLNNVVVCGISPQPSQIASMRNGADEAWMNQGFQYVGWATLDLAFRLLQNLPPTVNDATQPVQLITSQNAATVSEEVNIPIPTNGLNSFMKLWKVS